MELRELEEKYHLELDKILEKIREKGYKSVLLQFPDGLKQYATKIVDYLESKNDEVVFSVWLGSCFGACDIPNSEVDLIVQFGHAPWGKKEFNEA